MIACKRSVMIGLQASIVLCTFGTMNSLTGIRRIYLHRKLSERQKHMRDHETERVNAEWEKLDAVCFRPKTTRSHRYAIEEEDPIRHGFLHGHVCKFTSTVLAVDDPRTPFDHAGKDDPNSSSEFES